MTIHQSHKIVVRQANISSSSAERVVAVITLPLLLLSSFHTDFASDMDSVELLKEDESCDDEVAYLPTMHEGDGRSGSGEEKKHESEESGSEEEHSEEEEEEERKPTLLELAQKAKLSKNIRFEDMIRIQIDRQRQNNSFAAQVQMVRAQAMERYGTTLTSYTED